MKELYVDDVDFGEVRTTCKAPSSVDMTVFLDYHIPKGFFLISNCAFL